MCFPVSSCVRRLPLWSAGLVAGLCLISVMRAESDAVMSEYSAQTWTTEDGLPHNRVSQVAQDSDGFIWVGTQMGLARFDGRTFRDFPVPKASQRHGPGIRGIVADGPAGLALIPTTDQVLRLENGVFSIHPITPYLERDGQVPTDIFAGPDGALWIGTARGNLFRWQKGKVEIFGKADGIDRRAPVFSFAIDGQNRTWIATGAFLGYYSEGHLVPYPGSLGHVITVATARSGGLWLIVDGKLNKLADGKLSTLLPEPPWGPLKASVRRLFEDRTGRLWIAATRHGFFWYENGDITPAPLPQATFGHLGEDREGNLLLGSEDAGLTVWRRRRVQLFDLMTGLTDKPVFSVCEDRPGRVWIANSRGGLFRWEAERLVNVWSNEVSRVCAGWPGELWLIAADGLYRYQPDTGRAPEKVGQPMKVVTALLASRAGDLWLGGGDGLGILGKAGFRPVSVPDGSNVTAIAEDTAGAIWAGTESGGLFQLQHGVLQPASAVLPASRIYSLAADRGGAIWIGTPDGLLLLDGDRVHRFAEPEGLPDHIVLQIVEDDLGDMWLGGRRGFFHVSRAELLECASGRLRRVNALAFGREEGMAGLMPAAESQPAVWKDHAGHLWLATLGGVIRLDPAKAAVAARPVSVVLDAAGIDDVSMTPGAGAIQVPPGRHRLAFQFVAPSPAPANLRFRYQMEGFDPDWIETAAVQPISYSRLPPGHYRLRVAARDGRGPWSDPGPGQAVVVAPAWWQRTPVRGAAAFAVLAGVILMVRHASQLKLRRRLARIEREGALERERARIARDIHDELGSGVAGLRFLVAHLGEATCDPVRVGEQLSRQTLQLALDLERVVWTVHPKNNSLDGLAAYVARFAQNLLESGAIRCVVRHHAEIPARPIAPETQHNVLALAKESLTNVIKHSRATEVMVETSCDPDVFILTISDNGRGFEPGAPEHAERNGLGNMRARGEEMRATVDITSEPGRGCRVRLCLPLASGS